MCPRSRLATSGSTTCVFFFISPKINWHRIIVLRLFLVQSGSISLEVRSRRQFFDRGHDSIISEDECNLKAVISGSLYLLGIILYECRSSGALPQKTTNKNLAMKKSLLNTAVCSGTALPAAKSERSRVDRGRGNNDDECPGGGGGRNRRIQGQESVTVSSPFSRHFHFRFTVAKLFFLPSSSHSRSSGDAPKVGHGERELHRQMVECCTDVLVGRKWKGQRD